MTCGALVANHMDVSFPSLINSVVNIHIFVEDNGFVKFNNATCFANYHTFSHFTCFLNPCLKMI